MEPAVKKYAEVAAFVRLVIDISERAGRLLEDHAPAVAGLLSQLAMTGLPEVPEATAELFVGKRDKTTTKLTDMMERYVGDDWDDPVEVLEWCSFYAGAGAAHCAIAGGRFKSMDGFTEHSDTLDRLGVQYRELLEAVIARLEG